MKVVFTEAEIRAALDAYIRDKVGDYLEIKDPDFNGVNWTVEIVFTLEDKQSSKFLQRREQ